MGGAVGGALGGAAANLGGGLASGFMQSRAARARRRGIAGITAAQEGRLRSEQARLEPFREAGLAALDPLTGLITGRRLDDEGEDFVDLTPTERRELIEADPGFQFRLEESQRALDRLASTQRGGLSGRVMLEAQRRAQGQAAQEFGNVISRLSGLAGLGQSAAAQQAGLAVQTLPQFTQLGLRAVGTTGLGRLAAGRAFQQFGSDIGNIAGFGAGGGFGGGGAGGAQAAARPGATGAAGATGATALGTGLAPGSSLLGLF